MRRMMWRRYHGRKSAARAIIRNPNLSTLDRTRRLGRLLYPWAQSQIVVVAAGMRTGSTVFCELAQALPEVETTYEALNPIAYGWMNLTDAAEAADLTRDLSLRGPVTVTKVFRNHLKAVNTDWDGYAAALPEARWIQLYRHDVVAQYVSLQQAKTSDQWLNTSGTSDGRPQVDLDLDHLRKHYVEVVEGDRAAFDALSQTEGFRQVRYEDFADDPARWAGQTMPELLGVAGGTFTHELRRQDGRSLSQRLVNPETLAEAERLGLRWHPAAADW